MGLFKKGKCKHVFVAHTPFIIKIDDKEMARMSYVCKKCQIAMHKRIYSKEQLKKLEEEDDE